MRYGRVLAVVFVLGVYGTTAAQITALDSFDRPDGDVGPAWTQILPGLSITSDLVISGRSVRAAKASTAAAAYYSAIAFADDQFAQCVIRAPFYGGPVVRSTGTVLSGWNNYEAYASSATNLRIARHINNVPKTLANFPAPWAGVDRLVDGDTLRIEARGSVLRVLLNGVLVGSVVDFSHRSGSAGVITHNGLLAGVDDFAAGDLP